MIVGIDVGIKGALAFANCEGVFAAYIMPSDVTEVQAILAEHDVKFIYVEKAQVMGAGTKGRVRGDGLVGTFTYAKHYGQLLGMFKALRYPFIEVPPRTWQLPLHKGCKSSDGPKERSLEACYKLMPHLDLRVPSEKTGKLSKKPHDGLVDACLIAYYGHRDFYHWKKDVEKPPKAC